MINAKVGWLGDLEQWFSDFFTNVWDSFKDYLHDSTIRLIDLAAQFGSSIINALPAPTFMQSYNLGSLLSSAGPWVQWFLSEFQIAAVLGLIAGATIFRLIRKAVTLGQW